MKVKFMPQDVEFEIQPGQSIMALAHEKGIPIRSTCNGMPSCAECRVRITDGDWNVTPPSRKELSLIGTGYYIDQRRLSCQCVCFGDITVDTAEQIEKSAEGPVTKKFLTKVHKTSAQDSHSLGGVMLEQDGALLGSLAKDVPDAPQPSTQASLKEKGSGGGGGVVAATAAAAAVNAGAATPRIRMRRRAAMAAAAAALVGASGGVAAGAVARAVAAGVAALSSSRVCVRTQMAEEPERAGPFRCNLVETAV